MPDMYDLQDNSVSISTRPQGRFIPELYDLQDLDLVAGWEPYGVHDLEHVS